MNNFRTLPQFGSWNCNRAHESFLLGVAIRRKPISCAHFDRSAATDRKSISILRGAFSAGRERVHGSSSTRELSASGSGLMFQRGGAVPIGVAWRGVDAIATALEATQGAAKVDAQDDFLASVL